MVDSVVIKFWGVSFPPNNWRVVRFSFQVSHWDSHGKVGFAPPWYLQYNLHEESEMLIGFRRCFFFWGGEAPHINFTSMLGNF